MKKNGLLIPALFLLAWQAAASAGLLPEETIPSPAAIGLGLRDLMLLGMPPGRFLPLHILYSLERVFYGYTLAVLLGAPLGVVLGGSETARTLILPLVDFFRPIPPLAWIPLAILWFGIGIKSAAFIIFLGAFFPIALNACAGVRAVDPIYVCVARTLHLSRRDIWLKVLLPGALPSILTGARIGMGIAWMTLVAAEFTGVRQGYGLGYMIMSARDLQRTDEIMAGMAVIGVIGLCIEWVLGKLSRRLLHWN